METTVTCPSCAERVIAAPGLLCPRCGASVASEAFAAQAAELEATLARARAIRPPRSGGGTVNGWGTTLLHYRPRVDGTWDATKWFTIVFLPIVPLRGVHLRPVRQEQHIAGQTYHYEVLAEGKPEPREVLWAYGMALIGIIPALFAFMQMKLVTRTVGDGLGMLFTLSTLVWLGYVMTRFVNADKAFRATAEPAAATPAKVG
ncbi:MAG TPA: hypothetical protein VEX86_02390 [Longimicrobium sp.]|nr:hypothetical protein [Longimicrobium sp.]